MGIRPLIVIQKARWPSKSPAGEAQEGRSDSVGDDARQRVLPALNLSYPLRPQFDHENDKSMHKLRLGRGGVSVGRLVWSFCELRSLGGDLHQLV